MKKVLFSSLAVLAMVLVAQVVLAGPSTPPTPPTPTPIDGGLTLLIGGGIAYAAKKGYDSRKNNKA
jgi:hypothetical protein